MSQHQLLSRARGEGRSQLTEVEAKDWLRDAGFPVVETRLAGSRAEAVALSREMGFPVALKIASAQVVHKSDAGGVKLGLTSQSGVVRAYREIMASVADRHPEARVEGVSVQKMAPPGTEVIMGMSKDPQFGPVLMFGLGGIWVELLKDVSFRIVPILPRDAREMIREIKGFPLLEGYRGTPPAHLPTLEDMLLKLSSFVEANPEIGELDLNPVFAYPDGASVVDARIILED
ncbi:MAG: acetate--CoA ligase family protein [Dehalococcoidia bacterium]